MVTGSPIFEKTLEDILAALPCWKSSLSSVAGTSGGSGSGPLAGSVVSVPVSGADQSEVDKERLEVNHHPLTVDALSDCSEPDMHVRQAF